MIECKICKREFENGKYLSAHLKFEEHISGQCYYGNYLKNDNEGNCLVCGKPTAYINFTRGYQKCCSRECSNKSLSGKGDAISKTANSRNEAVKLNIKNKRENTCLAKYDHKSNLCVTSCHSKQARNKAKITYQKHIQDGTITSYNQSKSWQTRKKAIRDFCIENNCTPVINLLSEYGQGWLSLNIPRIYINRQNSAIENMYLPQIEQYFETNQYSNKSKAEQYIVDSLLYNGTIICNDRQTIKPKELDIYMPDLKIAIEFNGIYWHSIENGTDKYAHRHKSIKCRELGIRLIHIFEFEDLDQQIFKINQLILGNDLFEKTFTKNSLLDVPEDVYIVYSDGKCTLYGA